MVKNLTSVSGDKDREHASGKHNAFHAGYRFLFTDQSIIWPVKRLQAFKFQLRPGGQQEREMRRFAGACRFVFNRALARQNENHEVGNKYIPYGKMASAG
ncbi:Putative transposase (identified by ISEscan HMM) [Escherichia coli]|nr:Putative transposase (identified by ISEscan HMM) [Escherichia coli]